MLQKKTEKCVLRDEIERNSLFFKPKRHQGKRKNPKGVIILILKTSIEARPASFIL